MARTEVIAMARDVGMCGMLTDVTCTIDELERFAALVAAREREACAIMCEVHAAAVINDGKQPAWAIAHECAAAIRARGTP